MKPATRLTALAGLATVLSASGASAHIGQGDAHDMLHGFLHPFTGIDHVLAMASIGLLAAQLGGRAVWLVPASFLTMMVVSGALGMSGIALPYVDLGIALSVVALGALIATQARPSVAVAMGLAGVFAAFHGFAHGAELPAGDSGVAFALGFIPATALLHGLGLTIGLALPRSGDVRARAAKLIGAGIAFVGVGLVAATL